MPAPHEESIREVRLALAIARRRAERLVDLLEEEDADAEAQKSAGEALDLTDLADVALEDVLERFREINP